MALKQCYRVDRRDVAPGGELGAEGDYQSGFDNVGKQAETILEAVRASEFPGKPQRANCLFVTDDSECAESYWRTHHKRYLYEVTVDEDAIMHRGDMHLVDAIGAELKRAMLAEPDQAKCRELARKYWRQEETEKPCPEFLVDRARVTRRLRDLSDLKAYIRSQITGYDPADEPSIESMIDPDSDPSRDDAGKADTAKSIHDLPWSDWREASSEADAIKFGRRVWPEAIVGQAPNHWEASFAVDNAARERVIEVKNEDGRWLVRVRNRI